MPFSLILCLKWRSSFVYLSVGSSFSYGGGRGGERGDGGEGGGRGGGGGEGKQGPNSQVRRLRGVPPPPLVFEW